MDRKLRHPWEFIQAPWGWALVIYFDSGVVDHPLRQDGGHEAGKAMLPWYLRRHEIVGIGNSPQNAARAVLAGEKGARLRAEQIAGVGDRRRHLVFRSLDTREIVWPDSLAGFARSGIVC